MRYAKILQSKFPIESEPCCITGEYTLELPRCFTWGDLMKPMNWLGRFCLASLAISSSSFAVLGRGDFGVSPITPSARPVSDWRGNALVRMPDPEPAFIVSFGGDQDLPGQVQGVVNRPSRSKLQFAQHADNTCDAKPAACEETQSQVTHVRAEIDAAVGTHPRCEDATRLLQLALTKFESGNSEQTTRAYRLAFSDFARDCSTSFSAPSAQSQKASRQVAQPTVQQAALGTVAVVTVKSIPVCSGLITDQRFITARHCEQFLQGAEIRQASTGQLIAIGKTPVMQGAGDLGSVRNDWVVYPAQGARDLPPIAAEGLARMEPVFVLAAAPLDPVPATGSLREAIVTQPIGFCHALPNASAGCIEMQCPTVPTYSGSPVFRLSPSSERLEIIGLVRGSYGTDSGCSKPLVDGTFVVPILPTLVPGRIGSQNRASSK